ncbi:MAG TPA: hypothetical protein VK741_04415 [Acetobacteraceae bacterium]|nr:hypothetical protein [Acetobacteraceae bacterium]
MGLPLARRPEFVDQISDGTDESLGRWRAKLAEIPDEISEILTAAFERRFRASDANLLEQRQGFEGRIDHAKV